MKTIWDELEYGWNSKPFTDKAIARGRALERVAEASQILINRGDEMLPSPTDRSNFVKLKAALDALEGK